MAATKFAYLETGHLTADSQGEVSIQSLVDSSDALAEEAREVLPYSFDECTYSKGYLRQSIWSCKDCGEKGVCYGCSISCHAGMFYSRVDFNTGTDSRTRSGRIMDETTFPLRLPNHLDG
jgi:E3 ubiquitin-protein ligase UBR7